ncbi:MAG TPA: ECF-type sigma factor [Phycisphaerae bacterium]|nr:ECF-type sigma factor [Phycisphaerae bacterium]HRW52185.1 ECF-type sigma factor [Phycisphaerae bacterium]
MSEVTEILSAIDSGDTGAVDRLLPLVYDELRAIARRQMANERADATLQPTSLLHEAYLRLIGGAGLAAPSRAYFFAAAAEAMRRILIDRARSSRALKRGGAGLHAPPNGADTGRFRRIRLDAIPLSADDISSELLDLDDALVRLAADDPKKAELVKLRFFAGLSLDEAAAAVGVSPATADRHWRYARAWLYRELTRE